MTVHKPFKGQYSGYDPNWVPGKIVATTVVPVKTTKKVGQTTAAVVVSRTAGKTGTVAPRVPQTTSKSAAAIGTSSVQATSKPNGGAKEVAGLQGVLMGLLAALLAMLAV